MCNHYEVFFAERHSDTQTKTWTDIEAQIVV